MILYYRAAYSYDEDITFYTWYVTKSKHTKKRKHVKIRVIPIDAVYWAR